MLIQENLYYQPGKTVRACGLITLLHRKFNVSAWMLVVQPSEGKNTKQIACINNNLIEFFFFLYSVFSCLLQMMKLSLCPTGKPNL